MKQKKYYNMTELVLVLFMIGIGSVLFATSYGRLQSSAGNDLCFDNMMRISHGFSQYAADHSVLPPYNFNGIAITYIDAIHTYVQKTEHTADRFFVKSDPIASDDVWWCPVHLRVGANMWATQARLAMSSSYGYSRAFTSNGKMVKPATVEKPSEMLLVTECGSFSKKDGELGGSYVADQWAVTARHGVEMPSRKEGTGNTIYVDGSVRTVSIKATHGSFIKDWEGKLLPWDFDLDGK